MKGSANIANTNAYKLLVKLSLLKNKDGNYISLPLDAIKQIALLIVQEFQEANTNTYYTDEYYQQMRTYIEKVVIDTFHRIIY